MPFVIPIVAGVAITVAAASITSTVLVIAATIAISAAAYAAQKALTKKPKSDPVQLEGRTITVRQPIGPGQIWYGVGKQGGTIIFLEKDGNDTWIAICWAFHQVHRLTDVFLNDDQITVNVDGSCEGTFDGSTIVDKLFVYHHLGYDSPFNFDKVIEDTTATNTHNTRQSVTKAASALVYTLSVYAKAGERSFMLNASDSVGTNEAWASFDLEQGNIPVSGAGGSFTLTTAAIEETSDGIFRCSIIVTSNTDTTIFFRIFLRDSALGTTYTGDGTSGAYFRGAQLEQSAAMTAYVKTEGTASGANLLLWSEELDRVTWLKSRASVVANAIGQEADTHLMEAFPLLWTQQHMCLGRAFSVFQFVNTPTNFAKGIPQLSVYGHGHARIYDISTGTYGYSENPVLCLRDHLTSTVYGFGVPFTDIDDNAMIAEAAYCDEEVTVGTNTEFVYVKQHFTFTTGDVVLANDTISLGVHELGTGDKIVFSTTGTLPAPLVAGTVYYAIRQNNILIRVADTLADAQDGTRIDLTTAGTLVRNVWRVDAPFVLAGPEATVTSIDTAQDEMDGITDKIKVRTGSRFRMQFTSTIPAGLAENVTYFGDTGVGNGLTAALEPLGTIINITSVGANNRIVRIDGSGARMSSVNLTTGVVVLNGGTEPDWPTGTRVLFRANGGTAAPLVDGHQYYMILDGAPGSHTARIAATRQKAEAGLHINFTAAVSGTPYLESDYTGQAAMRGLLTGERVSFPASPNILGDAGGDYYWIRLTPTSGYVADTLEDARAGIARTFLTEPNVTAVQERVDLRRLGQPRFSTNGVYSTGEDLDTVQQALMTACAGDVLEPVLSGKWRIKAGRYRVPLHSLTQTAIRGDGQIQIQSRQSVADAVNTVRGNQVTAETDDQPADFPEYTDEDFIAEDGGEVLVKDIQLPFTNSKEMALRLAKIELMQGRKQRTITLPIWFDAAPGLEVGDNIDVTLPAMEYADKTFKVVERSLSFEAGDTDVPMPKIDVTARETGIDVYR